PTPADAVRELAHVMGAAETWLSRIQRRPARVAIWPSLSLAELATLGPTVHGSYAAYLDTLTDAGLAEPVAYVNSAGLSFTNTVMDILLHAALHGQYHRGKVNLLLRQTGAKPVPVDFIAFQRGVPAARTT
ncbi:MAG: DinB family protein, partial [Gemmatimonadaceae bacterium]